MRSNELSLSNTCDTIGFATCMTCPVLTTGDSGHSCRDTPGLIPNPAVKPAHVVCCTEVRESPGTIPSCYYFPSIFTRYICFYEFSRNSGADQNTPFCPRGWPQVHDLNDESKPPVFSLNLMATHQPDTVPLSLKNEYLEEMWIIPFPEELSGLCNTRIFLPPIPVPLDRC